MNKVRLSTKLLIPTIGQGLVLRPQLMERMDAGATVRLTLVSAPAGYGKTVLIAHWIHQRDHKVAWVSLDPGDNDPQCFWTYMAAALESVASDSFGCIIDMLHPSQPPSRDDYADLDMIIMEMINALSTLGRNLVLVLDDYHHIENHIIHETLSSFLRALPPNIRLIIASRSVPPLPLAWMRVSRQVLELNAIDLRFSRAEVETLCNGLMGLSLGEEDLDILEARTEGWPAGLQLAALTFQYAERPTSAVHAFSGGNRFVFDYLVEEVLKRQSEKIQRFLMQTSILTQLNAAVCAAVTGIEDAQAMLEGLDRARLFIEPLDQNRGWYRYHALFADSLRELLQRTVDRETISMLFKRASLWFEQQGSIEEAVAYALAAKDFNRAAAWLESLSLQMFQKNMLHTLIGWLKMLPDEVLDSNPSLRLYYAMALTATWQAGKAEAYLRKIEHSLSVTAEDLTDEEMQALTPEARSLYANATVMRCLLSMKTMDTSRAIRIAEHTLLHMNRADILDLEDDRIRAYTYSMMGVGLAHEYSGNPAPAKECYENVIAAVKRSGQRWVFITQWAWSHLGYMEAVQNRLRQAFTTYRQEIDWSLELNVPASSLFGLTHVGLGELYYAWDDLDAAQSCFLQGIALGKKWDAWDSLWPGYFGLARLMSARGNCAQAQRMLDELTTLLLGQGMHVVLPAVEAYQAMLQLSQGSLDAALRWASCVDIAGVKAAIISEWQVVALVRIHLAEKRFDEAQMHLDRLLNLVRTSGRAWRHIELLNLQAMLLQGRGKHQQALAFLAKALSLAEPERHIRAFVDEGPPMAALLEKFASARAEHGISPHYLGMLQDKFYRASAPAAKAEPLIEPLTERESDVLGLIARGLGYEELGARLDISINTVRTHIKAIYQKLGIHNRAQAADRARKLGLI